MTYNYKDKPANIKQLNKYMLAKTLSMFEYQGLPDTIPQRELERLLQCNGYAFITKVKGVLYAFSGSLAGQEKSPYNIPTTITINNVALGFNKTLDIEKDGVLVWSDDVGIGVLPLYEKYNTMLVENDINMTVWGINSRIQKLISAPDDRTKESADSYMKKIIDGELSIVGDNAMFEGVKMQAPAAGSGGDVRQMIEYQQFIKSNMFNEVGLSSNFNMKRERLISSEVDQAEDSLFPFVYNMMENRLEAVESINEKYGLSISVDFGSVWALKNKKLVDGVTGNNQVENNSQPDDNNNVVDENGEPAQGPETDPAIDPATDPDKSNSDKNEVLEDEQGKRQPDNANLDEGSGNGVEPEKQIAELQAVIDNPDSSEEDIKAAQELIDEINKGK